MEFLAGTALMVAAIALLGFAKYVITRWEGLSWIRDFAGTETMALIITMLAVFGIAFLCAGLASNHSSLGYTEFAGAIAVVVIAGFAVARIFRRTPVKAPLAAAPASRATI